MNTYQQILDDLHQRGWIDSSWGGDLLDLEDVAKDLAVKKYILSGECDTDDLLPALFSSEPIKKTLIHTLYREPYEFCRIWQSLVDATNDEGELEECFVSEALWTPEQVSDACALLQTDQLKFAEKVGNSFYQYCESNLREELEWHWPAFRNTLKEAS